MFRSARDYVIQEALPTYREFFAVRRTNPWGENKLLRRGVAAAVALFHLREQLPKNQRPTRTALEALCPDYGLVADIANSAKHGKLDKGSPRVSSPDQFTETLVSTLYKDERGDYPGLQTEIYVRLDDGSTRNLVEILHTVMTMWCKELHDRGIVSVANPEAMPVDSHRSRAECQVAPAITEITQGEDRQLPMAIRRFNYDKGCSEPVDLTGSKVEMRVWKPIESVMMNVAVQPLGVSIDFDVPIPRNQQGDYVFLKTDKERTEFVGRLVAADPELQRDLQTKLQAAVDAKHKSGGG